MIFASGLMVSVALEAAAMLAENGIQAAVANLHTIKPLDVDLSSNGRKIAVLLLRRRIIVF